MYMYIYLGNLHEVYPGILRAYTENNDSVSNRNGLDQTVWTSMLIWAFVVNTNSLELQGMNFIFMNFNNV